MPPNRQGVGGGVCVAKVLEMENTVSEIKNPMDGLTRKWRLQRKKSSEF